MSSNDSNCKAIFNSGTNNITISSVASFITGSDNVSKELSTSIVSGTTNTQNTVSSSVISGQNNTITSTNGSAVFGYENSVQDIKYVLISGHGNIVTNEGECAVGNYNSSKQQNNQQDDTACTLFSVGIGTGPDSNNRNNGIEVRNTGEVYINYTQIDDNNQNQSLFASCANINKLTFKDQTTSHGVKIEYMSIQHIIDWLACRVNNLYENISIILDSANTISALQEKNTELETRIAELENIIAQMQNK